MTNLNHYCYNLQIYYYILNHLDFFIIMFVKVEHRDLHDVEVIDANYSINSLKIFEN
jgi:hypothetical protein